MTDSPSDPEVHDADNSIGDTDPRWSDLRSQAIMFEQTREEMQWDHMDNIREVTAVLRRVEWEKKLLARIDTAARERLADMLGKGGKVVDTSTFYRNVQPTVRRAISPEKFWEWVGNDAGELFKADKVPITSFRSLARRRFVNDEMGDDDEIDRLVQLLEDTMFERKPSGPHKVEVKPIDGRYTPQYAAKMTPYKVSRRKKETQNSE